MTAPLLSEGKPDYTALDLPAPPPGRPYVISNMVASVDGKVVVEGTERGLGSPTDQRLMRELRTLADIVLNGAGTLRASGASSRIGDTALEDLRDSRGKARTPTAAVLSASGDLPLDRAFFTADDFTAVVYLSDRAPAERRAAIAATGRPVYDLPAGDEASAMLRHMREALGAEVVLVEGGPSLNGLLVERDLLDELFLTVGPVIVGGDHPLTAVENGTAPSIAGLRRLTLRSAAANPETGELYLRYAIEH